MALNVSQMVSYTMEAVCILLGSKPNWKESKNLLSKMTFMDELKVRLEVSYINTVDVHSRGTMPFMGELKSVGSNRFVAWHPVENRKSIHRISNTRI